MSVTAAAARLSLAAVAMLTLVACGGPAPSQDEEEARELGRDTDKTVFDDMIQTQDRARAVEGVLMDSKKDLDTAIDHADETASE
jgi:hypothetical protein